MSVTIERARAEAARLRFDATVAEVKARLAPAALAEDAKDKGLRFVRAKPAIAASAGLAATLLIFRRPIRRMFRRKPAAADQSQGA